MLNIKFSFQGEKRRCLLHRDSCTVSELKRLSQLTFPKAPKDHVFKYIDDEDESILVSSDEELQCAIQVMQSMGLNMFKFELVDSPPGTSGVTPATQVQVEKEEDASTKSVAKEEVVSKEHSKRITGEHPLEAWLVHHLGGGRRPEVKTASPSPRAKPQAPASYLNRHGHHPVFSDSLWPYNSNVRYLHRYGGHPAYRQPHRDNFDVFSALDAFSNVLNGAEAKANCRTEKNNASKLNAGGIPTCASSCAKVGSASRAETKAPAYCVRPHPQPQATQTCNRRANASTVSNASNARPRAYMRVRGNSPFDLISAVLEELLAEEEADKRTDNQSSATQAAAQTGDKKPTDSTADKSSDASPASSSPPSPKPAAPPSSVEPEEGADNRPALRVKTSPVFMSSEPGSPRADNMPIAAPLGDDQEDDEREWQVVLEQRPANASLALSGSPSPSLAISEPKTAPAVEA